MRKWDPETVWVEHQFSGYQAWGGEQPDEHFWAPNGNDGKPAFEIHFEHTRSETKKSGRERLVVLNSFYKVQDFEVELELVSRLDAPNKVQIMIRYPKDKTIMEACINKNYKFQGHWDTQYSQYTLTKPTRYSEHYV